MTLSIGLDFGTTNTVATMVNPDGPKAGQVEAVHFAHNGEAFDAFRSVLCFSETDDAAGRRTHVDAGPWAIDQFVELAERVPVHPVLQDIRRQSAFHRHAGLQPPPEIRGPARQFPQAGPQNMPGSSFPSKVSIGRPVELCRRTRRMKSWPARITGGIARRWFRGNPPPSRSRWQPPDFFAQRLNTDATILVADFGGGTSDFSVVRFSIGPRRAWTTSRWRTPGVGVAGDGIRLPHHRPGRRPRVRQGPELVSWAKVLPVPNSLLRELRPLERTLDEGAPFRATTATCSSSPARQL